MSGDWRRLHRVRGVSSGSPENHWVPWLIRRLVLGLFGVVLLVLGLFGVVLLVPWGLLWDLPRVNCLTRVSLGLVAAG
jgi:hypothetical protein